MSKTLVAKPPKKVYSFLLANKTGILDTKAGSKNYFRTTKICGIHRHSDLNASLNIRRIAVSADIATGIVNYPNIAAQRS